MDKEKPVIGTGQTEFPKWTTRDQKRFKRALRKVKRIRAQK